MKHFSLLLTISILILTNSIYSQESQLHYSFDKPDLILQSDGYTVIEMDNCLNYGEEGFPLLPKYGVDLLLPKGKAIDWIEIIHVEFSEMIPNINAVPAERLFPISQGVDPDYKVIPNASVYQSNESWPEEIISASHTGLLSGHSIGSFSIDPIRFHPALTSIQYIKNIDLTVHYKVQVVDPSFLKNTPAIQKRIQKIVDNQEPLPLYTYPSAKNSETDLLLITKESLVDDFEDYLQYKTSTGFVVQTISTEEIYSTYSGQDEQDKIRNCIIDIYQNSNLQFVILGGDAVPNNASQDIIPHRGFFAVDDSDIPADMYYCCLDGNWNNDGDNRWGESREYDLYAELAIGRICVDNTTEIEGFTHKLYMYQNEPVLDDIEKCLMIGEELNNNPWTFGGDYKDEIASGGSFNGFYTAGVSDNFDISRLYDRDMNWSKNHVFNIFNNTGCNLLNHLGHSSPTYNMKMYNSDITTNNFENDGVNRGYVIGYSQGCYNGSFDNRDWNNSYGEDCFAEKITTLATAEVAALANSRYGWYSPGATNSTSQYVDRQFYDAIFGEDITLIGYTNGDSKEDVGSYFTNDSYMRWTVYEINLFGDPSMDIWTAYPTDIVTTYSQSISIGSPSIDITTDVGNARVGLMQNNVLIGRGLTDENDSVTITFFEPINSTEPIAISIIAHNKYRYEGEIVVVSNQPYVIFDTYEINDINGNNNQLPDYNEEIMLGMAVKNVGDQPATNVMVTMTCDDFVTFTDQSENYGNFDAGETKYIEDAFTLTIADDIPDNQNLVFVINAEGEDNWVSSFQLNVCAPSLSISHYQINDENGNDNGRLDPGESAEIIFTLNNSGQSASPEIMASLSSNSNFVQIINENFEAGILDAEDNIQLVYEIEIDASTPMGSMVAFNLEVNAMAYSISKELDLKVGMFVEDWESGSFDQYDWSTSGDADWILTTTNPYEGDYCTKSGSIGDEEFTQLSLLYNCMYDDTISFYLKVSTEESYDYLKFYIDGSLIDQWAGEISWQKVSYPIDAGNHLFRWKYEKDTYVSSGDDCVWVDFIELPTPFMTTAYAGSDGQICSGEDYNCQGEAMNYNELEWTTSGNGTFNDPNILEPIYTPGSEDVENGMVTLNLFASGNSGDMDDDMELTINPLPVVNLGADTTVCYDQTVILDAGNPGAAYLWSTGETTQTIEASSDGNVEILTFWVEVINESICMNSDEINIEFVECLNIQENNWDSMVKISPNPGNGLFQINLPFNQNQKVEIIVFDNLQQQVYQMEGVLESNILSVDLSACNSGIYFLQIQSGSSVISKKIIISN